MLVFVDVAVKGVAVKKGFLSNCSNLRTVASISDRILIRYSASKI